VSEEATISKVWESIPVGDDLGTLDYVLTAQMVADYRRVVDNPHAAYPTVAARHPANLFYRKYAAVMRVPQSAGRGQTHHDQRAHCRQVHPPRQYVFDRRSNCRR